MHFVLCRAVARCQGRRLLRVAAAAPLPAAIVVVPRRRRTARSRSRRASARRRARARASTRPGSRRARARPVPRGGGSGRRACLLGPTRAGLGQQIAAGPSGDRSAIVRRSCSRRSSRRSFVLPSLAALTVSLAGSFPGGLRRDSLSAPRSSRPSRSARSPPKGADRGARDDARRLLAFGVGARRVGGRGSGDGSDAARASRPRQLSPCGVRSRRGSHSQSRASSR